MLAGRHAAATLQAGFTRLRDLGTEGALYADVAIKKSIEDGSYSRSVFIHRHRQVRVGYLAVLAAVQGDPTQGITGVALRCAALLL